MKYATLFCMVGCIGQTMILMITKIYDLYTTKVFEDTNSLDHESLY